MCQYCTHHHTRILCFPCLLSLRSSDLSTRLIWKRLILFVDRSFFATESLLSASHSLTHSLGPLCVCQFFVAILASFFASSTQTSSSLISYLTNEWIEIWFDVRIIYFSVHSNSTYYLIFLCLLYWGCCCCCCRYRRCYCCCHHHHCWLLFVYCKRNISRVFILNSRHRSECGAMGSFCRLLLLLLIWWITNNKNVYFCSLEVIIHKLKMVILVRLQAFERARKGIVHDRTGIMMIIHHPNWSEPLSEWNERIWYTNKIQTFNTIEDDSQFTMWLNLEMYFKR